ncbi:MAG: beta-ketoacyl synthase chain length factor [Steroidobacteraceae bacterium]
MRAAPVRVYIEGIGVWSPGLEDWARTSAVLRGEAPFKPEAVPLPSPAVLPAAERRRSPATARIAVQVASEACGHAGNDASLLPSVFASSHGDTEISDYLCRELAGNAPLSPTKFHNSVHNAASGYWTIAVGCMQSATALSGGDESFAYGLLEAGLQAVGSSRPVLLVAYDHAAPAPLSSVCSISRTFGVAFVLSPVVTPHSIALVELRDPDQRARDAVMLAPELLSLHSGNPAARALPLLSCLAAARAATLSVSPLCLEITPCR